MIRVFVCVYACSWVQTHTCVFTVYLCVQVQGWPRDLSLKELPSPLLLLDANCPALGAGDLLGIPSSQAGTVVPHSSHEGSSSYPIGTGRKREGP